MPVRGQKFISEFLIPSLNSGRFGQRLRWISPSDMMFQLQWNHKSASGWTENDACVFAAWDRKKGHYEPSGEKYYIKSKQRFRAVLNKLIGTKHIVEVSAPNKNTKVYCIVNQSSIMKHSLESFSISESTDITIEIDESQCHIDNIMKEHQYASVKQDLSTDLFELEHLDASSPSLYSSFVIESPEKCSNIPDLNAFKKRELERLFPETNDLEWGNDFDPYLPIIEEIYQTVSHEDISNYLP